MKKIKNRENGILILLFAALVILSAIQIGINNNSDTAVFSSFGDEESSAAENDLAETAEFPFSEEEQPDIYDLTGYIFKNSQSYMDRLKTEINNMANASSDNDHLYEVAESIKLNQISYYTMLSQRYESGNEELIEACKSYAFNVETLAANMMEYINESRTKYISRAMICIANDTALTNRFTSAQAAYKAARTETETSAEAQTEAE